MVVVEGCVALLHDMHASRAAHVTRDAYVHRRMDPLADRNELHRSETKRNETQCM